MHPVWQGVKIIEQPHGRKRLAYPQGVDVSPSKGDVVEDRSLKNLVHPYNRHLCTKALERIVADVIAIHLNHSLLRCAQPPEDVDESALAIATAAGDRHTRA